jgi:hypothetical protein
VSDIFAPGYHLLITPPFLVVHADRNRFNNLGQVDDSRRKKEEGGLTAHSLYGISSFFSSWVWVFSWSDPMADAKKDSKSYPRIRIKIPNVSSRTKVADLRVGQLVDLMVQVHSQLPIQRGMPSAKVLNDALNQVHKMVKSPDTAFRRTQMAILKAMPKILHDGPWAPKDAGPAPPHLRPDARKTS